MEWKWNNQQGSRGRQPACLVVTSAGDVVRFTGVDLRDAGGHLVVKVIRTASEKAGKWSNSTFFCVSPEGTQVVSFRQSWEEGLLFPQGTWEEGFAWLLEKSPVAAMASFEALVRREWLKTAARWDENRAALAEIAGVAEPQPLTLLSTVVAPTFTSGTLTVRAVSIEEVPTLLARVTRNLCGHPVTVAVLQAVCSSLPEPEKAFWDGTGQALAARPKGGVRGAQAGGDTQVGLTDLEFALVTWSPVAQ